MFRLKTAAGIVLAGVFTASGAFAHETYSHTHRTGAVSGTTYSAPTIDLGPIEYLQPDNQLQYTQPSGAYTPAATYIQPATVATTTPITTGYTVQPAYRPSTLSVPFEYTTPSYAAQPFYSASPVQKPVVYGTTVSGSVNTVPATTVTYGVPSYSPPVTHTAPSFRAQPLSYIPPVKAPEYDGTRAVKTRMDRLRTRIRNAVDRGDIVEGERQRLRRKMRNIRDDIRDYKANDGLIDKTEHAALNRKMSRQSQRIVRLVNNRKVKQPPLSYYGYYKTF